MTKQFFLFGTRKGYSLWEQTCGAYMPAKVSRNVVSRAKTIRTLIDSVKEVMEKTSDPIRIDYNPPARAKKTGGRALKKNEIKKAHKIFLALCHDNQPN